MEVTTGKADHDMQAEGKQWLKWALKTRRYLFVLQVRVSSNKFIMEDFHCQTAREAKKDAVPTMKLSRRKKSRSDLKGIDVMHFLRIAWVRI
jgi:hypothetical protein